MMRLSRLQQRLLNDFQREFPLAPEPYAELAGALGVDEATVLELLETMQERRVISRVGPVFAPNRVGVSTLAAMAVPPDRLEQIADFINAFPEVNHNYEREHRFNLWFVITAASTEQLAQLLAQIEEVTGLAVLSLPLLEEFHIDLGFPLQWDAA